MKATILAGAFLFVTLFVLTTFMPSQSSRAEAEQYGFKPADIDNGLQYSFERSLFAWAQRGLKLAVLIALVCTSLGRKLADRLARWAGQRWLLTLLAMALACDLALECLRLPFGLVRLEHSRAWGMTNRTVGDWLHDHFVALSVSTLIGLVLVAGPYVLMRLFPRRWWIVATAVGLPLGILYALLSPVLISPLFNTFTPLAESAWARKEGNRDKAVALEKSMRNLTDESGIEVGEVLVVDASRQSYHSNAYFSGFGPTRRI